MVLLGLKLCTAIAIAAAVANCSKNTCPSPTKVVPCTQLRLAYAGGSDMSVGWNTPEKQNKVEVCWGESTSSMIHCAQGESSTYLTSTTWNNHVKMSPLQPGKTYYYRITDDKLKGVYKFKTAPEVKADTEEWKFAFVGDLGTMGKFGLSDHGDDGDGWALEPGEETTIQSLSENVDDFEFLWHDGDIAYADYWLKETLHGYLPNATIADGPRLYEKILNMFYVQMANISGTVPYMVGPGNHEANCDNGGSGDYDSSICVEGQTNFTGYRNHFRMPYKESGATSNMWYSWEHGNVHFIQFNTETDLGEGIQGPDETGGSAGTNAGPFGTYENEQIDWLKNDLKNVDRSKTPWVIAAGHRPWYVSLDLDEAGKANKKAFEQVLKTHGVDVILFGHVHNYERFTPIYKDKADKRGLDNPKYPWYILNGAAGHYDGLDSIKWKYAPDGMQVGIDDTYGWSRFTVHNATHLTHEFIASGNSTVLDTSTLYKKR